MLMDVKIERRRGLRGLLSRHWLWGACALLVAPLAIWLLTGDIANTSRVDTRSLNIAEVTLGLFDDYTRVDGHVLPASTVQVSVEEGGIVMEKVAEEGAKIKTGDVIMRLANSNLDLQILNAEAELAEKQNILRNTRLSIEQDLLSNRTEHAQTEMEATRKKRIFEQKKKLYDEKLVPREEYIQAKEDYDLAIRRRRLISQRLHTDSAFRNSQVAQLEENLANMQKNLELIRRRKEKLEVKSPIDGELSLLDAELGQSIAAGQRVGQVNDISGFKMEARIDEHYIDRVHSGLTADLIRDGKTFELTLRKVFPEVRDGTFKVEFLFTNRQPENLRSGQTFTLNLRMGRPSKGILIPKGTFYSATGGKWIFVLDSDGKKAYRRNIRLGRQNPAHYEVLEGLEPGERVIVNGYEAYGDAKILKIK